MTDKSNNAKESLAKIIENAKTKEYEDMSATEQLTSLILQYGQGYDGTDVFGSAKAPVSLALDDIKETKVCNECRLHSNYISLLDDVPKQFRFAENFCNGFTSFRPLANHGVEAEKGHMKWTFHGIGEAKKYHLPPTSIRLHFEQLVKDGHNMRRMRRRMLWQSKCQKETQLGN